MRVLAVLATLSALTLVLAGCSRDMPLQPGSRSVSSTQGLQTTTSPLITASSAGRAAPGAPGYEPAYEDGRVVTINAIEVPGKAPAQAQADFYEVIYPPDWQALGIPAPQCNPCDHDGGGIDPLDYHDHVLDSAPGDPEYRAPWHVYAVAPAYNGDPTHDAAIGAVYRELLPIKSEAGVDSLLARRLPSGAPLAVEIDTNFYFLCAVVSPHAMR